MKPVYFILYCLLGYQAWKLLHENRRRKVCGGIFGALFSCGLVFGYLIETQHAVFAGNALYKIFFYLLIFFVPSVGLYELLHTCLEKLGAREAKPYQWIGRLRIPVPVLIFAVIFIAWIPVWLAFYPCIYGYDAMLQTHWYIHMGMWSNQQPLLHTFFIDLCWAIAKAFGGGIEQGMAIYAFVQMAALDGAITYALTWLYPKRPRFIPWLVLWFALFPVHPMLAISVTKDTLFAALVLVLVVYFFRVLESRHEAGSIARRIEACVMVLLAAMMILLRNNALYALVAAALVTVFLLRGKERKVYVVMAAAAICLSVGGKQVMMTQTGATESPISESLGVPLQQMARVASRGDQEIVSDYISEEAAAAYRETIVDPVRWTTSSEMFEDMGAFVTTWIRVGLQYPRLYIDAFLANTAGYWYLDDNFVASMYYLQTQSINYGDGECDVIVNSKLNILNKRLDRWFGSNNQYQNNLVLSCLCSMALYTWILIFYLFFTIEKKQYRSLVPALFLVMYLLTLLLGPCALMRYVYLFFITAPVLLVQMVQGKRAV